MAMSAQPLPEPAEVPSAVAIVNETFVRRYLSSTRLPPSGEGPHGVEPIGARLRLARSGDRIRMAMGRRITEPRSRMERLAAQLEALSPLAVLARGYSVARLADGRVARRRADLPSGTGFTLRVSDGAVPSRSE